MPHTLLVLGGSGFFGKSILDAFSRGLLAQWNVTHVIAAARRPQVLAERYPELLTAGVELLSIDLADQAARLPAADYVVHAANTTDARAYQANPAGERAAIVAAADHFAERVVADCPDARVVYASSGAVYGAQPGDVAKLDENAPLATLEGLIDYKRDYAKAKQLAEQRIARLGREAGTRVSIARCFAFVGPYLPLDQHFAVGNFLADGLAGRSINVTARHPVIRSYLHADDLVRWLMAIAVASNPDCPIFNVGSDEGVDVAEVAQRVALRCGVQAEGPERAAAPIDRYVPSIERARTALGLAPTLNLDAALTQTLARLRRNRLVRTPDSATDNERSATGF